MSKRVSLTNETPRQTLIAFAINEMRVTGCSAHDALESVVDGAQEGTLAGELRKYYLGVSDAGFKRLIKEVARGSHS